MTDDVAGSDAEADRIIDKLKYSKRELEIKNLVEYCKELSKKMEYLPVSPDRPAPLKYYTGLYSNPIITYDYITKLTY
jgi:hypothetical protein